jgi:hypothetical protein
MDGQCAQVEGSVASDRRPACTFAPTTSFIDAVPKRVEAPRPGDPATRRPDDPDDPTTDPPARPYRPRRTRSIASSLHSWVRMIR